MTTTIRTTQVIYAIIAIDNKADTQRSYDISCHISKNTADTTATPLTPDLQITQGRVNSLDGQTLATFSVTASLSATFYTSSPDLLTDILRQLSSFAADAKAYVTQTTLAATPPDNTQQ